MKANDIAILELSSFQLDQMTVSPNFAAILNVTPNHLDRHGTMEAYTAAKARILEFQSEKDAAVLDGMTRVHGVCGTTYAANFTRSPWMNWKKD
jgi:UDP-N-acetylmuramoylalanine-D-glutamate ligase